MHRTEHREDKWLFPFVSYEPDCSDKKFPLILQLHGAGERGNGQDELYLVDRHGFAPLAKNGERDCIFVMPQCPKGEFWAGRVESIIKFIEQLKNEFNVDEDRVYLTGLSMGGYGTWYTAMARPDLFAAISPLCGGGMAWNAKVLTMPIWVFHGADDNAVNVRNSDEMVEALKKHELDVKYTRMDGVGHNVWDYAYNEEHYDWFMSKRRKL